MTRFDFLLARVVEEFPNFRIVSRNASWLRIPFAVLAFVTRRKYDTFTTTIGSTMYVAENWWARSGDERYRTLRHELIHVRQFHRWPLGRNWPRLNHVLMAVCYLLLPLPVLWTFRARLEREGYTQTLLVEYELHGPMSAHTSIRRAEWMAETFGGSAYAWMWRRKKARLWALDTIARIHQGEITNERDRVYLAAERVLAKTPVLRVVE
jgi:hypothetical protein